MGNRSEYVEAAPMFFSSNGTQNSHWASGFDAKQAILSNQFISMQQAANIYNIQMVYRRIHYFR